MCDFRCCREAGYCPGCDCCPWRTHRGTDQGMCVVESSCVFLRYSMSSAERFPNLLVNHSNLCCYAIFASEFNSAGFFLSIQLCDVVLLSVVIMSVLTGARGCFVSLYRITVIFLWTIRGRNRRKITARKLEQVRIVISVQSTALLCFRSRRSFFTRSSHTCSSLSSSSYLWTVSTQYTVQTKLRRLFNNGGVYDRALCFLYSTHEK